MESVGASKAKTHLSELLDRVEQGERITITRHGVPTATLVPVTETKRKMSHDEIVEGLRELRKSVKPDSMSIKEMINEGRRI